MYRQIIGYLPSNAITAIVSMVMIYAYTRLLSPGEFGSYSYVFSAVLVLEASLFHALPIAVMRFYPAAVLAGRRDALLKEAYLALYGLSAVVAAICIGAGLLVHLPPQYRVAAILALPLLLFRSMVQLNQAVNRSSNSMGRFTVVECLHAVLGFGFGLAGLFILGRGADAIILGLLIAAVIASAVDTRLLMMPLHRTGDLVDRAELVRLVHYAWPIVGTAACAMIMQTGDRFLLGSLGGADMLGIFTVAYSLVERPTTMICSAISSATFPLVVQVLEQQGKEAARIQAGRNGIALLAVTLPACVGLALTADYIASSVVGPAFRGGVATLIPIMSCKALARGLRYHFIDHAFHLSGRSLQMLWNYVPATVATIVINVYLIPRYGMMGAAWTALCCQIATVIGGWYFGNALFPVWLPVGQVIRCVAAIVPMAVGLTLIHFPLGWFGLIDAVLLGSVVYGISAILLNVGEIRPIIIRLARSNRTNRTTGSRTGTPASPLP